LDYLVIGHLTGDKTQSGIQPGGTAAYAALTAQALGCQSGILTAFDKNEFDFSKLNCIPIISPNDRQTTVFENRMQGSHRQQMIHQWAGPIPLDNLPKDWHTPTIVHIGPVANEVEPSWLKQFSHSYKGFTPQGIMRTWGTDGIIHRTPIVLNPDLLGIISAIIFSIEDVAEDEDIIDAYARQAAVVIVTEGSKGVRVFCQGEKQFFPAPVVHELDSTGAGDIFAAAFFCYHAQTQNPWQAAKFAAQIAAISVTRNGLDSVPTLDEIKNLTWTFNKE
jgi:hypothetical protein